MADFRRVLGVLAVLLFVASLANAQPFACQTSFVRPALRAEGLTELIGDIVFDCNGVTGQQNLVNFTVFTDARITSRTQAGTSGLSEALLLIDDPGPAPADAPVMAPTASGCTGTAPAACTYNVFQGTLSAPTVAAHSVTFLGVPIVPTGTNVRFRITNIRINASDYFGSAASGAVVDASARLSISPSEAFNFEPASGVIGRIQKSMTFEVVEGEESFSETQGFVFRQCVDIEAQKWAGFLSFQELFGTAFKARVTAPQDVPGFGYNTESGLLPTGLSDDDIGSVADYGTRLRATFNNIPDGVTVLVSNGNINTGSDSATAGAALLTTGGQTGAYDPTGDAIDAAEEVTIEDGTGVAIWEVRTPVATAIERYDFGVDFEATANPQASPVANLQGTVTGNYAPTPTNATNAAAWANARTSPIPRFVDPGTTFPLIFINLCKTNLLFPYVLGGVAGFDTGIAITNTSTDPFDTTPQSGTCDLNFYGASAPAAVFTTPSIGQAATDQGAIWATNAMSIAPAFTGYIIAQCNFQYAHGFAFVSDIGAHDVAMGYLALILPDVDAIGFRPNNGAASLTSESLNN